MRTVVTTRTLYLYSELTAEAKEKARDWYREASAGDHLYAEVPTDEFRELLAACGFNVDKKTGLTWRGFGSQGDGAAFGGTWYASDCKPQTWLADGPVSGMRDGTPFECPHNKRWHDAVAPLVALAADYPTSSGQVNLSHRYNNMHLEYFDADIDAECSTEADQSETAAGEVLIEAARGLADAFYWTLESEYDYQNSDEAVAETITCNEYEFTKDGKRA